MTRTILRADTIRPYITDLPIHHVGNSLDRSGVGAKTSGLVKTSPYMAGYFAFALPQRGSLFFINLLGTY